MIITSRFATTLTLAIALLATALPSPAGTRGASLTAEIVAAAIADVAPATAAPEDKAYLLLLAARRADSDPYAQAEFDGLWAHCRTTRDRACGGGTDVLQALSIAEAQWGNTGRFDYGADLHGLLARSISGTLGADLIFADHFEFVARASLSVGRSGAGTGTVTSAPAGIDCGADCVQFYAIGTQVTLTATPSASSSFAGWSGGGCSGTGTCTTTMTADTAVFANFALNQYTLGATRAGTGAGTITSSPAGIDCGADCSEVYDHGTVVTLSASPSAGSTFSGWSGGCSGTGSCVVTLTAATTVTATFSNRHTLTTTRAGTGSGAIASAPAGIDCGADCSETYDEGTLVTLTATPNAGSTFSGWSGGGCTGTDPCAVTLTAATLVTATFTLNQYPLTAIRAGNGNGTISSSPSGIDCGADCTEVYDHGTTVTLTATPDATSTFIGWSGSCTGNGSCIVTLTAARSVTATFALRQYTLTVSRAGTGTGTVTSSPAGINCGADCTELYNHGTIVVLAASPAAGSTFNGWSGGGCTGTGSCVVNMTAAASVTATFNLCPSGSTTFNFTGGMQTFTVPACVTSITIDAYGAQGGTSTGESGGQNLTGGLGARARGTFSVSGGQTIDVLVGGMGANSNCGSGGGGGSFAVRSGAVLLAAGGGGGGFHCTALGGAFGAGGNVTTSGGSGVCTTNPSFPRSPSPGGSGGNGAAVGYGGGGGGFLTAGQSTFTSGGGGGAYPGAGGVPGGGFGGGGGRHTTCCGGSGGGGGFSGGGGSQSDGCAGGGGGSVNNGTSQVMTAATRAGNGVVIISY